MRVSFSAVVAASANGSVVALSTGQRQGGGVSAQGVRVRPARFKAPKHVVFGELPKTFTGRIQKFVLCHRAWAGAERGIQ